MNNKKNFNIFYDIKESNIYFTNSPDYIYKINTKTDDIYKDMILEIITNQDDIKKLYITFTNNLKKILENIILKKCSINLNLFDISNDAVYYITKIYLNNMRFMKSEHILYGVSDFLISNRYIFAYLTYINISNFKLDNLKINMEEPVEIESYKDTSGIDIHNKESLIKKSFLEKKLKDYDTGQIITDQKNINFLNLLQLEKNDIKITPIILSYEFDSESGKYELFLVDGNHRLCYLLLKDYICDVPVIIIEFNNEGILTEKVSKRSPKKSLTESQIKKEKK